MQGLAADDLKCGSICVCGTLLVLVHLKAFHSGVHCVHLSLALNGGEGGFSDINCLVRPVKRVWLQ